MYYWKSIGNSLKLTFLEQHEIKKILLASITKLKIIQLIDNDNTMHSQTAQNSKIEFAEHVTYLPNNSYPLIPLHL